MAGALPYDFITLPYQVQFGGGLRKNFKIRLRGRTFEKPKSFTLRLSCGKEENDDAPFILVCDIQAGQIVLKRRCRSWWSDDAVKYQTAYFKPATAFDFTIGCEHDGFVVQLGQEAEYKCEHKLPFYTARYLRIIGDLHLQEVSIAGVAENEENIRIPVTRELPEKIQGTRIVVCGIPVRTTVRRMAIDFATDTGNLAFHFNPRFHDQILVRNNKVEAWGSEERELQVPFPFVYGVAFELTILIDDGFHVLLNGYPLCSFRRNTPGKISKMNIFGSVVITNVDIQRH